jgi:lipid-binding SYLF domain-containing protein
MFRTALIAATLTALVAAPAGAAPPTPARTLEYANQVLDDLAAIPLKGIPPALLAEAQGVAIIPGVVKAGFVVGGRGGHGLIVARDKDGNWGEPVFVNLGSVSIGLQAGVESADVVLVFRTRKSLDRLLEGKGKVTLGGDAAVAAGPVGRMAAAATDARLEAEILSYSRARGLFAGVALDGAVIRADAESNREYRMETSQEARKLAAELRGRLDKMSRAAVPPAPVLGPPITPPPAR